MKQTKQTGVALILTVILLLILSVMAVSLIFLAQSETWSSLSYRLMDQARDVAEAGIDGTANYLQYSYTPPASSGLDPVSNYNLSPTTVSYSVNGNPVPYPITVTYNNSPVILSTNSNVSSNYPSSTAVSNFRASNSNTTGSLAAGNTAISYSTYAVLLNMRTVTIDLLSGSPTPVQATLQTWLITSDATVSGSPNAQVELSAILEREVTPAFNYAAFAVSQGCSALQFGGGGKTDSYDSSVYAATGILTISMSGGNVGTNGNLTTKGSPTTIGGSLSTPRTGVGTCSTSNVTAWQDNGGTVTGGLTQLPQSVAFPTPIIPAPGTTNLDMGTGWNCPTGANAISTANGYQGNCATSGNDYYLPPGNYGDIKLNGKAVVHLSPGQYNINSFQEAGANTGLIIDQSPCSSPCVVGIDPSPGNGPVILNVTGNSVTGSVVDLTGNSVQNPTLIPTLFQMMYAGTGTVSLKGGTGASGLMYAPKASYSFNSAGGNWYGAVVGQTMTDMGGATINYDRNLQNQYFIIGNYMLSSFTWKKY